MCLQRAAPMTPPLPGTTLSTPSGMPASAAISARRRALKEVWRAGLTTTLLPVARMGPSFQAAIWIGKFQGRMAPTTPRGSRTIMATLPGPVGATFSYSLSIASACQRKQCTVSGTSMVRQSVIGLPASRQSSRASSPRFFSSRSAKWSRTCFRSAGERLAQTPFSKERRAALTARSTSALSQEAILASGLPVAGLIET